jgi:hypothetical protein
MDRDELFRVGPLPRPVGGAAKPRPPALDYISNGALMHGQGEVPHNFLFDFARLRCYYTACFLRKNKAMTLATNTCRPPVRMQ